MQNCKTAAVGPDGEDRSVGRTAAVLRRSIQRVVEQRQAGSRITSIKRAVGETVQISETGTVDVEFENSSATRTAALRCRPIKGVAGNNQRGFGIRTVGGAR